MSNRILTKFNDECTEHIQSELNIHLLSTIDLSTVSQYYLTEYQRCMNEQKHVVNYIEEQLMELETLKLCETNIDEFFERLKAVHQYERKQNEIFEQILRQLTKTDNINKDETRRLLEQIDELIISKTNLIHSSINKLPTKSSDTFKNIL